MTSANQKALRKLNYLYQICKAGERGFGVVAANVTNRGLKLILKTCAQQRARFADELKGEIQRLGGAVSEQGILLLLGVIHRGRIDIFATLTIGAQNVENVVLSEALLGEKAAVNAYQGAMATILPAETRALLERQYQQVKETHEQVALLRGRSGKRLVVRLFDSEQDVEAALRALEQAGFLRDSLETVDVKEVTSVYTGKGSRVSEAIVSGAVGGALWGSLVGAVAGLSVAVTPGMPVVGDSPSRTWAVVALGGTVLGAVLASFLGLIVGTGVSEEDTYLYDESLKHGLKLVRLHADTERAGEAAQIMYQINAAARGRAAAESVQTPSGQ